MFCCFDCLSTISNTIFLIANEAILSMSSQCAMEYFDFLLLFFFCMKRYLCSILAFDIDCDNFNYSSWLDLKNSKLRVMIKDLNHVLGVSGHRVYFVFETLLFINWTWIFCSLILQSIFFGILYAQSIILYSTCCLFLYSIYCCWWGFNNLLWLQKICRAKSVIFCL